jgi:hypothetical protein
MVDITYDKGNRIAVNGGKGGIIGFYFTSGLAHAHDHCLF